MYRHTPIQPSDCTLTLTNTHKHVKQSTSLLSLIPLCHTSSKHTSIYNFSTHLSPVLRPARVSSALHASGLQTGTTDTPPAFMHRTCMTLNGVRCLASTTRQSGHHDHTSFRHHARRGTPPLRRHRVTAPLPPSRHHRLHGVATMPATPLTSVQQSLHTHSMRVHSMTHSYHTHAMQRIQIYIYTQHTQQHRIALDQTCTYTISAHLVHDIQHRLSEETLHRDTLYPCFLIFISFYIHVVTLPHDVYVLSFLFISVFHSTQFF